jgi:outer membrane protein OmpA-like peptidoglycan-associated protein
LRSAFGAGNVSGDIRVDGNVRRAAWLPRLSDLFTSLRTSGATLAVNGNDVRVGGWLSAADREALTARLKPVFGTEAAIGALGDAAADAVRAANEQVLSALGAIGTSGVSPDTVVRTMNLAIINFPTGSSEIPAESNEVIRRSAEAISKTENATIEISGHTDNVGSSSANLALSQARADSVKTALVNAGAPATRLVTRGYGDSRPRASNDSEYGRFQNRRIEYSVVQ